MSSTSWGAAPQAEWPKPLESAPERPAPSAEEPGALWSSLLLLPLGFACLPSALWPAWPQWLGPASFGDPLPMATVAGRLFLLAAPLLVVLGLWLARAGLSRTPELKGAGFSLLGLWLVLIAAALHGPNLSGADQVPFEAASEGLPYAAVLLGLLAGRSLLGGRLERLTLGLATLSLLASGVALLTALLDRQLGLAGVLGNSGPSTQLSLPGAVAGLGLAWRGRGAARVVGAVAALGFLLHAALAPALGGLLALWVAALALLAAEPAGSLRRIGRLGLLLTALTAVGLVGRGLTQLEQGPLDPKAAAPLSSDWSGAEVRLRLWSSAGRLLAEQGEWSMLRLGRFQNDYAPLRDPRERALSEAGSGGPTTVEHLHNDWLQALFDLGWLVGGLTLLVGALSVLWLARALPRESGTRRALCAALLGLFVLSLQHAPLTRNAPVAWIAGLLLGALLQGSQSSPLQALLVPTKVPRPKWLRAQILFSAVACLTAGVLLVWPALALTQQGHRLAHGLTALAQRSPTPGAAAECLPTGIAARYTAPLALELALRLEPDPQVAAPYAERLALLRPFSAEAQVQLGLVRLRNGNFPAAQTAWLRALELDPANPTARANLARLELEHQRVLLVPGGAAESIALLAPLPAGQIRALLLDAERYGWIWPTLIAEAYLNAEQFEAWYGSAPATLAPGCPPSPGLAERIDGLAQSAPEESDACATLRSLAHHLWAQENAQAGRFDDALRSYRQALRQSRWAERAGSGLIRTELAEAARRVGRVEEALREEVPDAAQWTELWPRWMGPPPR